jgi:signal transduction histidine kinase/orotate phosphoribosyltransferase
MRIQTGDLSCAFADAEATLARIAEQLRELSRSDDAIPKERILASVSTGSVPRISLHGLTEEELSVVQELTTRRSVPARSLSPPLAKKLQPHLEEDQADGDVRLNLSLDKIVRTIRRGVAKYLADVICSPEHGILHPEGCYLIPSQAFAEGYVELHLLFANPFWRRQVIRWLRHGLDLHKPDAVIIVGPGIVSLAQDAIPSRTTNIIILRDTRNIAEMITVSLLPKDTKVVLLTDVIGTQRSLNAALDAARHLDVLAILCVVDARFSGEEKELKHEGVTFVVESIARHPLQFWYEDKPPHYRYEDVIRVDPLSNAPIKDAFPKETSIWKAPDIADGSNSFLTETLADSNSLVVGHFETSDRHYLYLFLTSAVADISAPIIADVIRKDVERFVERDAHLPRPEAMSIVHPDFNPGTEVIVRQISVLFGNASVIPVSSAELQSPQSFNPQTRLSPAVIVFDNAFVSGHTARQLLDYAERNGAKSIFVYILCNRAAHFEGQFLQKSEAYGRAKVHVRYLSELLIPTFLPFDCPVCAQIRDYERLLSEYNAFPILTEAIKDIVLKLQKHPSGILADHNIAAVYLSTPLSERVRMFALRADLELARTSVLARKRLSDIAREHDIRSYDTLLLFRVIAYERTYFSSEERFLSEVFYDSFRRSLLSASGFFFRQGTVPPKDLADVAAVSLMFDKDCLSDVFRESNLEVTEELAIRATIELLLAIDRSRELHKVALLLSSVPEPRSAALETLRAEIARRSQESRPSSENVHTFRRSWRALGDHSRVSNLFGCIEWERIGSYQLDRASTLVEKYWREIAYVIREEVLSSIRYLGQVHLSTAVSEELQGASDVIMALVKKTDELAEIIMQTSALKTDRQTALVGVQHALDELFSVLLAEETHSVPVILSMLRTELGSCASNAILYCAPKLSEHQIQVAFERPDSALFVFGHESDVFTVLRNFLENVSLRAFPDGFSSDRRGVKIEIRDLPQEDVLELVITDSGVGVAGELSFGAGLQAVSDSCRRMAANWHVTRRPDGKPGSEASVRFYRVSEH